MRWRTGVMNSQWAGECGDRTVEVDISELRQSIAAEMEIAKRRPLAGYPIASTIDGDGQITVTELVEQLEPSDWLYKDWKCQHCDDGCIKCNDGWKQGEDRFVVVHNGKPWLCLERYYIPDEEYAD